MKKLNLSRPNRNKVYFHPLPLVLMLVVITMLNTDAKQHNSISSNVTAYYVSENGDDTYSGERVHPLKTIQEALDRMTEEGDHVDTIFIFPGIYRETITTTESGTSDSPKIIRALKGGDVIVSATEVVDSWTGYQNGIYKAAIDSEVSQVFAMEECYDYSREPGMDPQEIMVEARWPNKPEKTAYGIFYNIDDGGVTGIEFDPEDHHSIYVTGLPEGNYVGAKLFSQGASRWWSRTANITVDKGRGSLQTDDISTLGGFDKLTGMKGYICGPLHLLDAPKEWSWKSGTLYFKAPHNAELSSTRVEAKVRPYVIQSDFDHIHFEGIKTFGGAVRLAGHFNVICDMDLRYLSHNETWIRGDMESDLKENPQVAVALAGDHATVENCKLYYSGGSGISISSSHVRIENNLLKYTNYLGHFAHSIELRGENNLIVGNELHHTGKEHIRIHSGSYTTGARKFRILYNNMSHNAYTNWDVGAITMWGVDADGGEIAYNWISESVESGSHWLFGIYFDNNNREFLVHHNVIWNISGNAIRFNSPSDELYVYNNTFGECRENIGGGVYYNPEIRGVGEDRIELTFANNYHSEAFDFPPKHRPYITASNNFKGNKPDDFLAPNFNKSEKEDSSLKDKGMLRRKDVVFSSGVVLPSPTTTVDGKPDIGAYEFGGVDWRPGLERIEDERPNIIFVLVDDCSAAELSAYATPDHPSAHQTPVIDELAEEGMLFTTCWATPFCMPTRALYLSGKYGCHTRQYGNKLSHGHPSFPANHKPLSKTLQENGYKTAISGKWHLPGSVEQPEYGFDEYSLLGGYINYYGPNLEFDGLWFRWPRSFDTFHDIGPIGKNSDKHPALYWNGAVVQNGKLLPSEGQTFNPDQCQDFALDFIKRSKEGPFYLYYPLVLIHSPWVGVPDGQGGRTPPGISTQIPQVERYIKELVSTLKEEGIYDNTVVFLAGDNATEGFGKGNCSEYGVRVPLIVFGGAVDGGGCSDALIDFSDMYATSLDLAGISPDYVDGLDGVSFKDALDGKAFEGREFIFSYIDMERTVRTKDYMMDGSGGVWQCTPSGNFLDYRPVLDESLADQKREELLKHIEAYHLPSTEEFSSERIEAVKKDIAWGEHNAGLKAVIERNRMDDVWMFHEKRSTPGWAF